MEELKLVFMAGNYCFYECVASERVNAEMQQLGVIAELLFIVQFQHIMTASGSNWHALCAAAAQCSSAI